jgi:hypothetical protein
MSLLKEFNSQEKKTFTLIALCFFLFFILRYFSNIYFLSDSYDYLEIAKFINSFSSFDYSHDAELFTRRPFIYPLFLAPFVAFQPVIIILIQSVLSLINVYLFFKTLIRFKIKINYKIVLFLLLTPSIFIYSQLIMSEWLVMIFLNILFLLLITPFNLKSFAYIQIITILIAFIKPIFYPFIYFNLLFFAFYFYRKKIFSLWLFFPILILQFYLNINEQATGYKHFSSIENHILVNYNIYYFKSSKIGKLETEKWLKSVYEDEKYTNQSFKNQNIYLKQIASNEIKNHFFEYSKYHFLTAIRGVFDPGRFDLMTYFKEEDGKQGFLEILNGNKPLNHLIKNKSNILILVLVPIFLFNLIKLFYFFKAVITEKQNYLFYYFLILFIYYVLVSGPINCSRYLMPFQMILIAIAYKSYLNKPTTHE